MLDGVQATETQTVETPEVTTAPTADKDEVAAPLSETGFDDWFKNADLSEPIKPVGDEGDEGDGESPGSESIEAESKETKKPEEKEEKQEAKPDDEKPDEKSKEELFEVKIDGEKEQVSREELIKSYERYGASTRRFQQASEKSKEAEAQLAEANETKTRAQNTFNRMLQDPNAMFDIYMQYAPKTLEEVVVRYVNQYQNDQTLKEKDPDLYKATVNHRQEQLAFKRQQEELRQQREQYQNQQKQLAEQQKQIEDDRNKQAEQTTAQVYNDAVPKALKEVGVTGDMLNSRLIQSTLRQIVSDSWPDDLLLSDLPGHVKKCAEELVKDPAVKAMLAPQTKEPKPQPATVKKQITDVSDGQVRVDPNITPSWDNYWRNI